MSPTTGPGPKIILQIQRDNSTVSREEAGQFLVGTAVIDNTLLASKLDMLLGFRGLPAVMKCWLRP